MKSSAVVIPVSQLVRISTSLSLITLGRGLSQKNLVCQISCIRILVLTVTGVAHPKRSKICNDVCSTSILVGRVLIAGSFLGASPVDVFQRRPNSPTVRFGSLVLSLLVTSLI